MKCGSGIECHLTYMIARSAPDIRTRPRLSISWRSSASRRRFFAATNRPGADRYQRKSSPTRPCRSWAICFVGLGTGAFSASVFHVMTHAFFKALLFLGARQRDSRAFGEQDFAPDGRSGQEIPLLGVTLFCAGVAIAGVPPFSGFFSKDAILAAAYEHGAWMYGWRVHRRH